MKKLLAKLWDKLFPFHHIITCIGMGGVSHDGSFHLCAWNFQCIFCDKNIIDVESYILEHPELIDRLIWFGTPPKSYQSVLEESNCGENKNEANQTE